jgi:hypothetical protein
MNGGHYETAQICLNGHIISSGIESSRQGMQELCDICGKRTIIECPECKSNIRGKYKKPNTDDFSDFDAPKFCSACGKPFPWTESKLDAIRELIDIEDKLDNKDKGILKNSLDDIITENPKTQLAATKFKLIMAKVGKERGKILYDIIVDVASETAKKTLLG